MSNPDDPKKKPPPQPTVAWDPADMPDFAKEGDEGAPEPTEPPAPTPPRTPSSSQPTVAMTPEDMPDFGAGADEDEDPAPPASGSQPTMAMAPEDMPDFVAAAAAVEAEAAAAEDDEEDPLLGQLLRGKWRVLKRLGAGSFGTVYKVKDEMGGWIEALKILGVDRLTGAEGENMRKRFLREAQIMKRLGTESKHIVGLSTYEEDIEAGLIYFLMEYVEGRPLSDVVHQDGPFDVERTIQVGLQVCDALVAAHEGPEPVVHRDLKLENLMMTLDRNGEEIVKVLDFGIAKIAEKEADSRLTTVGTLGTPGYAAPEQLRAEAVDGRTDLFAFGVILYSLLTGRDPWLGGFAHQSTTQIYDLMVASERGAVRPFDDSGVDVPPAMQNIVMKLLQRDPAQRFQTASELRVALLRVQAGAGDESAASLRVLTDDKGVRVEIRSGRKVVKEGATPCSADGIAPGTYRVAIVDERFEPVEATVNVAPGAMEDVTLVATPRSKGVGASVKRRPMAAVAAVVVVVAAAAAVVLQPWGRTLTLDDLASRAADGSLGTVWLAEAGVAGTLSIGPLSAPFRVPLGPDERAGAVEQLRTAGVDIDTAWEVHRLVQEAAQAQASRRYFGADGSDVATYARRIAALEPGSPEARSLLLKVGERMAWDAQAAIESGSTEEAGRLLTACLSLVPDHPRCASAGADR